MKINSFCLTCLVQMQEAQIHNFQDEEKKMRFMREVLGFCPRVTGNFPRPRW